MEEKLTQSKEKQTKIFIYFLTSLADGWDVNQQLLKTTSNVKDTKGEKRVETLFRVYHPK